MDSKEGRSLLTRTMSFRPPSLSISARARALRDRFANSKRSLSDSWKDQSFLDETSSDIQESPSDNVGSVQSLIKNYPRKNTSTPTSSIAAASIVVDAMQKPIEPIIMQTPVVSEPLRTVIQLQQLPIKQPQPSSASNFISQRSKSLDSLNNLNTNNDTATEPLNYATNEMDFPSPPLLDTPTLSPVNSMPFSFASSSAIDFSSTTIARPRPIKSASFRQLPNIPTNKNTLSLQGFATLSTTSLPPNLPPPLKPLPKKIIEADERDLFSETATSNNFVAPSNSTVLESSTVPLLILPPSTNTTTCQHVATTHEVQVCVHHSNEAKNWKRDLSGSVDPEEWRDTVSEVPLAPSSQRCTPPAHLFFHPSGSDFKPKLKHQWSVDESRISAARDRQGSDVSTNSTAPLRTSEKRRRFFMRKQTNSAPDSFDGPPILTTSKSKEHHSVSFCLGSVLRSRNSDTQAQQIPPPAIKAAAASAMEISVNNFELTPPSPPPSPPIPPVRRHRPPLIATHSSLFSRVLQNKLHSEPELGVEHLSDLSYPDADPPCHFCCKQTSTSIHDENRLKIVSRGLVRSRDGSREGGGTHYMNLPSPNVQTECNHEDVFKPGNVHRPSSSYEEDDFSRRESCDTPPPIPGRRRRTEELEMEEIASTPPASVLARRRALVPPKLMADPTDETEEPETTNRKLSGGSDGTTPRTRRSSIVVIPPMQICPGDLLVYSKVLTQRNNLLEVDGSTSSLAVSESDGVNSRKNKTTWSLLKLFDRSNRAKSESLCGLEEVLSCIQRSEFNDEQLSKYRGMCWSDFVVFMDTERDGKCTSGGKPEASSSSSSSSNNNSMCSSPERPSSPVVTQAEVAPPPVEPTPPSLESSKSLKPLPDRPSGLERRLRIGLMRTQSEKSFERRIAGAMWRGLDKALPERVLPRPTPLIPTLSEKDLLGSKEALASPVSTVSRNESKRREALWDLFQSECAFLYDHLMVLKNVFMEPLKSIQVDGFAMFAEPELLFGNLDELCCVTYAFCKEFINLILQNVGAGGEMNSTEILVTLFQKSSKADSVSQAYHCYALNYINALNYLETLRRHLEFCEFEKWCNRDPRCKKLQLTDLLVAPVQHIMKVPLILKELENRTEEAEEREIIARILEMEENSLRELDDKMKWLKNFERLLEIQRNIVWPSVLELDPKMYVPEFLKPALARQPCDRIIVSPRRQIIMEGPLNLWDSGKPNEMHVVLFDDMLLISRRKKGLSKKKSSLTENWPSSCSRGSGSSGNEAAIRYVVYKQPLSLDRFFIHDVNVPEGSTCRLDAAFVLVSLNRFQQIVAVHTFQAASDQLKQNWLLKLRDTQDKWKRTLQHTVFRSPRLSTCSSRKSAS